ncbi:metallophosphoesterase [Acidobacteriota bacterium]
MKNNCISFKKVPVLLALLLFVTLPLLPVEQVSTWEWKDVDRVVAVGDIHGEAGQLKEILLSTELVDESMSWTGGTTHLVLCGDLLGRGEQEKQVLDLAMKLEIEALKAGGHVHVLLGNHDMMNLVRDLRYVRERNYEDFAAQESEADRQSAWEGFRAAHAGRAREQQLKEAFDDRYPPGYFARLSAVSAQGVYGSWLLQRPAIIKLDDTVYVHGGLTLEKAQLKLEGINREVQSSIREFLELQKKIAELMTFPPDYAETSALVDLINSGKLRGQIPDEYGPVAERLRELTDILFDVQGPLWHRENALEHEALLIHNKIDDVLKEIEAEYIVIAHTPTEDKGITSRYHDRILRVDVAMVYHVKDGNPWALIIDKEGIRALPSRNPAAQGPPRKEPPEGQGRSSILEQLPNRDLEDYLKKAKIIGVSSVIQTKRGSKVVMYDVEHDNLEQRAVFNTIDEMRDRNNPQARLETYKHVVAAYRISRMLELKIVPPVVIRKIDRQVGSLILFPETARSKEWLITAGLMEDLKKELAQELADARGIFALFDIDMALHEDLAKMLLPRERRILLGDLGIGFSFSPDIHQDFLPGSDKEWRIDRPLSPYLELKLQELERKELRSQLKGLLSNEQIDALLSRRDRLLELSARLGN